MDKWLKALLVMVAVTAVAACGTKGGVTDEGSAGETPTASPAAGSGAAGATTSGLAPDSGAEMTALPATAAGAEGTPLDPLDDPNSAVAKRTVYFDFDSSTVRNEDRTVIEAHAAYLVARPSMTVTLECHADERGSREYNLALGERRCLSVRQMLLLLGVAPAQIEMVSYGEEKPAVAGHDESAWRLNRRVEFVYQR